MLNEHPLTTHEYIYVENSEPPHADAEQEVKVQSVMVAVEEDEEEEEEKERAPPQQEEEILSGGEETEQAVNVQLVTV